jgi:hypothetical protein
MEALDRPVWNPARQCTATARSGERCQRQPIPGGKVCALHGGRAPQVQQSARARLLAGADLAIDYLLNLLTPKPPCEHCGRSDAERDPVVVRACQLVLDRSGFHPTLAVEQVAPRNEYEDFTEDQLIEKLETLLKQCYASRDFKRQQLNAGVVDGVVDEGFEVPEDDEPVPLTEPIQNAGVQFPLGNATSDESKGDK